MYHADSHCDSLTEAVMNDFSLFQNTLQCDLSRLNMNKPFLQYFAIFLDPDIFKKRNIEEYEFFINKLDQAVEKYNLIKVTDSFCINEMLESCSIAALFAIEALDCVHSVEHLEYLYRKGVRCASLTWNHSNQLASGVNCVLDTGLTALGRSIVKKAEALGMILDVSHLSPNAFFDIIELTSTPIIASHSNAKAICRNRRNLSDDQIRLIAERKGYIGVNLYPPFLADDYDFNPPNAKQIVDHICYINDLAGEGICGLGCDFDGIGTTPEGVHGVQSMGILVNELHKRGLSAKQISMIMGENLIKFTHRKLTSRNSVI